MQSSITEKLDRIRQIVRKKFPSKIAVNDPRVLDYIYELVFTEGEVDISRKDFPRGLESIRDEIFHLPEFKAAVDMVAYNQDLVTRKAALVEGLSRCRLCGSTNTTVTVRPIRSSDEAPTMLMFCGSCNHRTTQTGE